ncbi:tape measure protein [Paenimyroides ceti]
MAGYDGGVITRKDIITDEALQFGKVFKENVDISISSVSELLKLMKQVSDLSKNVKGVGNQADFRKIQEQNISINQKLIEQTNKLAAAERELERIKQESLRTNQRLEQSRQAESKASVQSILDRSKAIQSLQRQKERETAETERSNKKTVQGILDQSKALESLQRQREKEAAQRQKEADEIQKNSKRNVQSILDQTKAIESLQRQKEREAALSQKQAAEAEKARRRNIQAILDQAKATQSLQRQRENEIRQQERLNAARERATKKALEESRAYVQLQARWRESQKVLQDLITLYGKQNAATVKAQRDFDALDKKIREVDAATKNYSKNVGNYQSAFGGLGSFTSQLAGALGWAGAINTAVNLGKAIYSTTKELQSFHMAMKAGAGDEETYNRNLEFLTRITEQYGLELLSTSKAYNKFYVASKEKLSIIELQQIFEDVSKASATMGLSIQEQDGIFKALEQMMSKGTVQAEELRGQLGDRLPGAFGIMAKSMNVTTEELGKLMKDGKVIADEVLPEFAKQLAITYGADKVERIETITAAENRFKNAWTESIESINSGNSVISDAIIRFYELGKFVTNLIGIKKEFSEEVREEQIQLNVLVDKITDVNVSNGDRSKLIEKLKETYPEFLKFIKNEDFSNQNLLATLNEVNASYERRIKLRASSEVLQDYSDARDQAATQRVKLEVELRQEIERVQLKYGHRYKLIEEDIYKGANEYMSVYYNALDRSEAKNIERIRRNLGIYIKAEKNIQNQLEEKKKAYESSTKSFQQMSEAERQVLEDRVAARKKDEESIKKSKTEEGLSDKEKRKLESEAAKAKKDALKNEKDEIDKKKKLYQEEIDLNIWKANNLFAINDELNKNDKKSADERFAALDAAQKAEEESLRLNAEKQLTLASNFVQGQVDLTKKEIQSYLDGNVKLDELSNDKQLILKKYFNDIEKLQKKYQKSQEEIVKSEAEKIIKKSTQTNESSKIAMNDEIGALQPGKSLKDIEAYEKAVADIKIKYTKMAIQEQINGLKEVLQLNIKNDEEILKYSVQLSEAEQKLQDETNKNEKENLEKSLEKNKEYAKKMEEIMQELHKALTDLTNAIFEARIQRIDEEIARNEEKTEREMELYEGNDEKQRQIQQRAEAEREVLEEKKRKEQRKQAIFNKAMTISEIGMNTALAIMKAYADWGPIMGSTFAVLISILGAVQTAAVLATPIPKYKTGRKGGKEEFAIVGDGGVSEVVEHKDGSAYLTPRTDTLVKLLQGDTVHKSVEDYRRDRSRRLSANLQKEMIKSELYLNSKDIETKRLEFEISSMHKTLKDKKMQTVVNVPKLDINGKFWKFGQRGW